MKVDILATHNKAKAYKAYEEFQNTYFASQLWEAGQKFKENFPSDSRVLKVINHAATKTLEYGVRVHRSGNFDNALIYYKRILSEDLVENSFREEATAYKIQAKNQLPITSADDLYNSFKNAYFISDYWTISNDLKNDYPNDPRLQEVIDETVKKSLEYAIKKHRTLLQ